MNLERIRAVVDELDREVPMEGATVLLQEYGGGPDESRIIATRNGILRMGIELLRAGTVDETSKSTTKDHKGGPDALSQLISKDSDVQFDDIVIDDNLKMPPIRIGTWIGNILGFVVILAVLALAVVGFKTVIHGFTVNR